VRPPARTRLRSASASCACGGDAARIGRSEGPGSLQSVDHRGPGRAEITLNPSIWRGRLSRRSFLVEEDVCRPWVWVSVLGREPGCHEPGFEPSGGTKPLSAMGLLSGVCDVVSPGVTLDQVELADLGGTYDTTWLGTLSSSTRMY
jgi:hypothetical protein